MKWLTRSLIALMITFVLLVGCYRLLIAQGVAFSWNY